MEHLKGAIETCHKFYFQDIFGETEFKDVRCSSSNPNNALKTREKQANGYKKA